MGVAMINPPPTQEQRSALHALGIDDDVIQLLTPEEREKAIRYLTPELVQKALNGDGAPPTIDETPTTRGPQQEQPPQARKTNNDSQAPSEPDHDNKIIHLAERAQEVLEITELEPRYKTFVGKRINLDGTIEQRPLATEWRQRVVRVPATIRQLHIYVCEARQRNIILIRGAPANLNNKYTRRWKAGVGDRGDHGFYDRPTELFFMDGDGIKISWRANPEHAVRAIVAQLGEPWVSASYVWFLSATCGLEQDEIERDGKTIKHWTGKFVDGSLRVRLAFLANRPLDESEAVALTSIAAARVPGFDRSICRIVQPNYIQRPLWVENPHRDVLGDIPTIGLVEGAHDRLAVPDNLTHTARWAKAQGHSSDIADHPDAESAVRGIGSDGRLREHMKAAIVHLLRANPAPEVVSFADHSVTIANKLHGMVRQYYEYIDPNLSKHGRRWGEVDYYLSRIADYALWCLNRPEIAYIKTIKLIHQEWTEKTDETCEVIFARVARDIEHASPLANQPLEHPPPTLLVGPPGSRKSTLLRAAVVRYVTEKPEKTAVILVPRHKLGDEQIELLQKEHPGGKYSAAVWRGRHADNPNDPDPERPGKFLPMCHRSEEAKAVEKAILDVESTLCKRGRGEKAVKCPLYDTCAYQQQKHIKANIWFAAHECAVHEMPEPFRNVDWIIFDENPLDAFMFGIDINDQVKLELDTLRTPLPVDQDELGGLYVGENYGRLMQAREELYYALNDLRVPIDSHQGVAVPRENLKPFVRWENPPEDGRIFSASADHYEPREMRNLTWRGKVTPDIRPDTPKEKLKGKLEEATPINAPIKKEVTLWELVEAIGEHKIYGRIKVHRRDEGKGKLIRMVGLRQLAKGWNVQTLICDATGDIELLRAIWPQLVEAEPHGWQQLPRPPNVRILQCVDRTISKWAVAVEGKEEEELERKVEGARQLYAAVLTKALEYGGADVGVITYKSTRDWIEKNCFVPEWLKLFHHGDVTGTNMLQRVRALFVIGRPLASAESVTQQTEALFGAHIPLRDRDYVKHREQGRIPIVPDAAGNNTIYVDVWEHPHPMGERLRRQITEGAIIQAVGRARAGLRTAGEPLDIHLWTDVPVPELGAVEPVLWSELEAGRDGLMLATEGAWLKNIADAARAFKGLFTADGLKDARSRRQVSIYEASIPALVLSGYQRAAAGCKPTVAVFLREVADPRGWLEERLGPLAWFRIEEAAARTV
jgi:hypothetical protein